MTLKERYLKAVAAQLSGKTRDDIIAELDDAILTRMEAREAELGRPLTEADEEAVLRETGHPLIVAAQYGSGPHHVVGPELYPWWMFGVKVGLIALVCITVFSALIRILIGDVDVGQAIGQSFQSVFSGGHRSRRPIRRSCRRCGRWRSSGGRTGRRCARRRVALTSHRTPCR